MIDVHLFKFSEGGSIMRRCTIIAKVVGSNWCNFVQQIHDAEPLTDGLYLVTDAHTVDLAMAGALIRIVNGVASLYEPDQSNNIRYLHRWPPNL